MRNYEKIDGYISELYRDIYLQPYDEGHAELSNRVINTWMSRMPTCHSVLDVGCGTGFCQPMFESWGTSYEGVCLGEDYIEAKRLGRNVSRMDFNFLDYPNDSFDLVFSRHSIEHSFSPLLSMMEWRRVAKSWLGIVVPAPEHYGFVGKNHYYVLNRAQWENLLVHAGWKPIWTDINYGEDGVPWEYWLMCQKSERI